MAAGRYPTGLRPNDPDRPRARFHFGLTGDTLPVVPPAWTPPAGPWPMDDNDKWGDCVVAGLDHHLQACAEYFGTQRTNWTDEEILAYYRTQNPTFDPHSKSRGPGTDADGGMNIQEFLEHLVKTGVIVAFGAVDHSNQAELAAATYIGLSLVTGVDLAQAQMQDQFDAHLWDYDESSESVGGHCIPLVGKPYETLACVTWGQVVRLTPAFIAHQMGEAWFVLTEGHIAHPGFRDNYDLKAFAAAVAQVTAGKVIVPVPPPTPPPTPGPTPVPVGPDPSPILPDASFPIAADLVPHIAAGAFRSGTTPVKWLDHRLRTYFHLKDGLGAHPDFHSDVEVNRDRLRARQAELDEIGAELDRLATFIVENVPGEPSRNEGVVDTAIRLLQGLQAAPLEVVDGQVVYRPDEPMELKSTREHVLFNPANPIQPTNLQNLIVQAVGAASACWSAEADGRVFDEQSAIRICIEVVDWIEARYAPKVADGK